MKQYIDADKLIDVINKAKNINNELCLNNVDFNFVLKAIDKLRETKNDSTMLPL